MTELERKLGYTFHDPSLLEEALTHSSFSAHGKNNERLEFLGDSVLSIIVAEYLYARYPDLPEGELTRLRAALVCEQALFRFSGKIELGRYLKLGKGEELTGGRERPSMVADAFEAVLAAIYLDGGMEPARAHVLRFIPKHLEPDGLRVLGDYKTALQELVQKNKEETVEYVVVDESGPDHNKVFCVEVRLNSNVIGRGKGRSKKQAEQNAAGEALSLMGYETR